MSTSNTNKRKHNHIYFPHTSTFSRSCLTSSLKLHPYPNHFENTHTTSNFQPFPTIKNPKPINQTHQNQLKKLPPELESIPTKQKTKPEWSSYTYDASTAQTPPHPKHPLNAASVHVYATSSTFQRRSIYVGVCLSTSASVFSAPSSAPANFFRTLHLSHSWRLVRRVVVVSLFAVSRCESLFFFSVFQAAFVIEIFHVFSG